MQYQSARSTGDARDALAKINYADAAHEAIEQLHSSILHSTVVYTAPARPHSLSTLKTSIYPVAAVIASITWFGEDVLEEIAGQREYKTKEQSSNPSIKPRQSVGSRGKVSG